MFQNQKVVLYKHGQIFRYSTLCINAVIPYILLACQNHRHSGVAYGPNIRPLRPIFYTPLYVVSISMQAKIDVNQCKFLRPDQRSEFNLLSGPIWLENRATGAHWYLSLLNIPHSLNILNVLPMSMWTKTIVIPLETFWETDRKSIFFLFGGENGPNIRPLGPLFYTLLYVGSMRMEAKIDVKSV